MTKSFTIFIKIRYSSKKNWKLVLCESLLVELNDFISIKYTETQTIISV